MEAMLPDMDARLRGTAGRVSRKLLVKPYHGVTLQTVMG